VGFSLRQFSEILEIRDSAGEPYLLVGGQAVNYWAERYLQIEPELARLQPFTSEDIDFKGNRDDVQRIARQLGRLPVYPHKVEMTALAGVIPLQMGELKSSLEVVRRIPGISDTVAPPAVRAQWEGLTIHVLDPISLLACKLELAATIPQDKRRDVSHLKILVPCVRAFLRELLERVELGDIPAKDWLKAANRVLKLTSGYRGRRIGARHRINWTEILPLAAIGRTQHEKLRRFQEQQLGRDRRKFKGMTI
jgi:hypothetical protein